jgi:hypothetical protein
MSNLLLGALLLASAIATASATALSSGGVLNSAGCSNNSTCGPSFCVRVPNASCCSADGLFPPPSGICPPDAPPPVAVSSVPCRQCTASPDARCTSAGLRSTLALNSGIKAAYCNDEFLVVHSDGQPGHPTTYLEAIQRPPGSSKSSATEGYASQCVTRSVKGQVS